MTDATATEISQERSRVYWLLGLPFDCIGLDEALRLVDRARNRGRRLVFATPNVNFIAQTTRDPEFRAHVVSTDLSLVDGMPLVWVGRMLGIPFRERVAGSTLVERLQTANLPTPIRAFFFGGEAGAAEHACRALEQQRGALKPVGYHYPGFGTIEEMSSAEVIEKIREARADFLIVSLGAKKGHAWISLNQKRAGVPVVSHLGAVVNFLSGRLDRAPPWIQRIGFEWVWRILQEPKLASRYWSDGLTLLRLVFGSVAPLWLATHWARRRSPRFSCKLDSAGGQALLRASGAFGAAGVEMLEEAIRTASQEGDHPIRIDLSAISSLDAHAVGWIYAATRREATRRNIQLHGLGAGPRVWLQRHLALDLITDANS